MLESFCASSRVGNYVEAASISACNVEGDPAWFYLTDKDVAWQEIVPKTGTGTCVVPENAMKYRWEIEVRRNQPRELRDGNRTRLVGSRVQRLRLLGRGDNVDVFVELPHILCFFGFTAAGFAF